ncbi:flagellar hook-length control protein FliK [Pontiellaceae bacterium B1224]|nr:flagellar hook-length control protein FliK [Pontiellaceae bacterium B1224]
MSKMESMLEVTPQSAKIPKKTADGAGGKSSVDFSAFLAAPLAEGERFQSLEETLKVDGEVFQSPEETPEAAGKVFQGQEETAKVAAKVFQDLEEIPEADGKIFQGPEETPKAGGKVFQSLEEAPKVAGEASPGVKKKPLVEGKVSQSLEETPKVTGEIFQEAEHVSAAAEEAFQSLEETPARKPAKVNEAEYAFTEVFIPVSEHRVFRRMAMRPQFEVAAEPESAASLTALEGKSALPTDVASRAPVQQEVPVLQPSLVNEKTIRLEQLADRFDQRLLSMVQGNEKVMRITVQPATMGRLTIMCREENSTLSVEIVAQTSGVRELIAGQEDAVRRLMQEHSVELGSFDVLMDQGQSGERKFGAGTSSDHPDARGTAPALNEGEDPHAFTHVHKSGAVSLIA